MKPNGLTEAELKGSAALTEAQLREIEERTAKATPGPWTRECLWGIHPPYETEGEDAEMVVNQDSINRLPDAEFIAHARTDIPALVAEVRRLRAALKLPSAGAWKNEPELLEYFKKKGEEGK